MVSTPKKKLTKKSRRMEERVVALYVIQCNIYICSTIHTYVNVICKLRTFVKKRKRKKSALYAIQCNMKKIKECFVCNTM